MKYTTLRGETKLPELVGRLYQIKTNRAKLTKKAGAALVRKNPALRDLKKVPAGTRIVVPDVKGITRVVEDAAVAATAATALEARVALAGVRDVLDQADARAASDEKLSLDLLGSGPFNKAARGDPAFKDLRSALRRVSKRRRFRTDEATALYREALATLDEQLAAFSKAFSDR